MAINAFLKCLKTCLIKSSSPFNTKKNRLCPAGWGWCWAFGGRAPTCVYSSSKLLVMRDGVHPGRLTWNLRIHPWKKKVTFQTIIFRFYVNLPGCIFLHDYGPRVQEERALISVTLPLSAVSSGGTTKRSWGIERWCSSWLTSHSVNSANAKSIHGTFDVLRYREHFTLEIFGHLFVESLWNEIGTLKKR